MRQLFSFIIAIISSGFTPLSFAYPEPAALIQESFTHPASSIDLRSGATIVKNKQYGDALLLPGFASVALSTKSTITESEGTIVFWFKPLWNERDQQSHVMLSTRWNNEKQGYLAISYGWWEPLGKQRLYFIVDNQQSMHCSTPYQFQHNTWVLISAQWKSGTTGHCAIYVNETKVAESDSPFVGGNTNISPIYIGSDAGTTQSLHRASDFEFDELRIFDAMLDERAIRSIFRSPYSQVYLAGQNEWDWMHSIVELPVTNRQTNDGLSLESRVLFDEDIHWAYSKAAADKILLRVKAAGFNVYVPFVWHGRGTYFPSLVTDTDKRLQNTIGNGYDPLAYLIERAHQLGLEIHPWFTVTRREWDNYPQFFAQGTPDGAYDVHTPAFRTFISKLIIDVITRYNVDGINLDYIRAMGICLSISCQNSYKKETGHELRGDYYLRFVIGSARTRLETWQDAAVTDIVNRVANEARKLKPDIILSVDGHPKASGETRPLEGRNELAWANNNLIDVIYAMDYRRRFDATAIDRVYTDLHNSQKVTPLFGNFDRIDKRAISRTGELIEKYVQYSRRKWPGNGVAFYIYNMLNDDQLVALKQGAFQDPARPYWPHNTKQIGSGAQ